MQETQPWQRRSLSRASSNNSAAAAATASLCQADVLNLAPRTSRGSSGTATPIDPDPETEGLCLQVRTTATAMAARSSPAHSNKASQQQGHSSTTQSGVAPLGQQLLDELERELQAIDENAVGNEVSGWFADFESVLAKMDRLQSGYQVQLTTDAAHVPSKDMPVSNHYS